MKKDHDSVLNMPENGKSALKRRLFVRKQPREAAFLGFTGSFFSWMILLPWCVYLMATGSGSAPKLIWLVVTVYFQLMAGTGYYALQRADGGKGNRMQAVLAGLFWPIAGLVFMPAIKSPSARSCGVMALGSVMCGVIGILGGMPGAWLLMWACLVLLVLSISWLPIGGPIRFRGWLPMLAIVAYALSMGVYRETLKQLAISRSHGLSSAAGQAISEKSFWEREAKGMSLTAEPLKSLIALYQGSQKAGSDLEKLRGEQGAFMDAVSRLTALPVRRIGHAKPASGHYVDMVVPEMPALRRAGEVCALELRAAAGDRKEVLAANRRLCNLRDRCLQTSSLLARLVGLEIEAQRVEALTRPLAQGTLTAQDWKDVLGQKIDWDVAFRQAMGDEATSLEGIFVENRWAPDMLAGGKESAGIRLMRSLLPLEMSVCSLRDHVFALETLTKMCRLLGNGAENAEAKTQELLAKTDRAAAANLHLVSGTMMPALGLSVSMFAGAMDRLELLKAAVAVMECRRSQGKLPDSLAFLPAVRKSALNGKPFAYEAGRLKVRTPERTLRETTGFRVYVPEEGVKPYRARYGIVVEL